MRQAEVFQYWNLNLNKFSSQCLVDQTQVQKPNLVVAANQMSNQSGIIIVDSNITDESTRKVIIYSRVSVGPRMESW